MLEIKTTGFEDFLDDSANIKALIIGGPGAGKTRSSSFWPDPFFIDCEDGRGSIADRRVPYVRVRSSKDMLDTLAYLKTLERTPKAQRKHKTVVVDTADAYSRIVKDEWVSQTGAASFTGFDAWGYLDTKMQLLFTRLLNLDYNVLVLVHYKDKVHKDGDNTVREYVLQLQGAIADQVFNDFDLVGWMGTYWEAGAEGREQKRGLTFNPTPDKPFLKDRYGVMPKFMPVTFEESDYGQMLDAFMSRVEGDDQAATPMGEAEVLGVIDNHEKAIPEGGIAEPTDGGPLPPTAAAEVPLDKMLKGELEKRAKDLGLSIRGNMLKSELVDLIKNGQETPAPVTGSEPAPLPTEATSAPVTDQPASSTPTPTSSEPDPWLASSTTASSTESSGSPQSASDEKPTAEPQEAAPTPASDASASTDAEALVAAELGGQTVSTIHEAPADTPVTHEASPSTPAVEKPSAPQGPSACAECGTNLAPLWAEHKLAIRSGFVKHRKYLCPSCLDAAA